MTTNIDFDGVLDVPLDAPVCFNGAEVRYFPVQRPRSWCFSWPLGSALKREMNGFDIVHIHSIFQWPATAAAYWAHAQGVPYIVRPAGILDPVCINKRYAGFREALMSRIKKTVYMRTLGRLELELAAAIHFTTESERRAASVHGLKPRSIVLPLGVAIEDLKKDAAAVPDLRDRFPQLRGKTIILYFSRLDPKKGLELSIAAMALIAGRRSDFAFVLAGDGTPRYEAQIAKHLRDYGLAERTVSLGHVGGKEKWSTLMAADIFILSSYQENFAVAVAEAMAAGVPVVISNRVNICDEVARADAGLVTTLSVSDIAAALSQLLDSPAARRRMGERGQALVRTEFNWRSVVRRLTDCYQELVDEAAANRKRGLQPLRD